MVKLFLEFLSLSMIESKQRNQEKTKAYTLDQPVQTQDKDSISIKEFDSLLRFARQM